MRTLIALTLALIALSACTLPEAGPAPDRIRITGAVVDESTSKPLAGVCIAGGKPGDCTWKSDAKGQFRIDGLIPAEWHLYFDLPDYKAAKVELTMKGGETKNVNVKLSPVNVRD